MEEKTGYIYILTNESFHKSNWVKIGYADNIERRVRELSNTSVPLPFEVYAYYEIPKIEGSMPDKKLHDLIQRLNPSLRISENREFFEIEPWDAYEILRSMAIIHNRENKLFRNEKNMFGSDEENEEDNSNNIDSKFPQGSNNRKLYNLLKEEILTIDPNVEEVILKNYVAIRIKGQKKNIVSIRPKNNCIEVSLNLKVGQLNDPQEKAYDISNRKWTNSQYAFRFDESDDLEYIKSLIKQSYDLKK